MHSFSFVCCLMAVCLYSGAPILPIQLDQVAVALRWPVVYGYQRDYNQVLMQAYACRPDGAGLHSPRSKAPCTRHAKSQVR